MPLSEQEKQFAASMSAAFASAASEEPGWQDKIKSASAQCPATSLPPGQLPIQEAEKEGKDAGYDATAGTESSAMDDSEWLQDNTDLGAGNTVDDKKLVTPAQFAALQSENKALKDLVMKVSGRLERNEFDKFKASLNAGFSADQNTAFDEMYEQCFQSSDPAKSVSALKKLMSSYPKNQSLSDQGTVVGPEATLAHFAAGAKSREDAANADFMAVTSRLSQYNLSAEDLKLGAVVGQALAHRAGNGGVSRK